MGRKAHKPAAKKEKEFSVWDESPVPYRRFKLDLKPDKFEDSHAKLVKDILALILEEVEKEMKALPHKDRKPLKVNGKYYTPLGGAFLVDLLNDGLEMEPVTLLYSLKDLYLQGLHVARLWLMLKDAEVPIPPRSQIPYGQVRRRRNGKDPLKDGTFMLPWTGNYNSLGLGRYQEFHFTAFRKACRRLREAPEIILTRNINRLRTPIGFWAVGISECVRFEEICEWVVIHSTDPLIYIGVILPEDKIKDIGEWGTNSDKCYEDDPPKRIRVVKRNLDKHSLLRCETVYEKRGEGTDKDSAAAKQKEDEEEDNSEEAEIEEDLDQEDKKEQESATDEQEFHEKNDEESTDEDDDTSDDEESIGVDFSADGHLAACISVDGKVTIRESITQRLVGTLEGDLHVNWVHWLSDGSFIIAGSASHEACLWSIEHCSLIRKLPSKVTCGDFSACGEYLCIGSADGLLSIWMPDLERRHVVPVGGEVSCLAITPESEFVITGSKDGSILVVDLQSGFVIGSLAGHMGSSSVTCLEISPSSSKILASGSSDGKVVVWDVVAQKAICVCFNEAAVRCLTWLGRTKYVACACEDGKVCIWDSTTGFLVGTSRKFKTISKLMMSPCGNELVVFVPGPARGLDVSMLK